MDDVSEGGTYSVRSGRSGDLDEGFGVSMMSADITTATWGGSTQPSSTQNDSAVSADGSDDENQGGEVRFHKNMNVMTYIHVRRANFYTKPRFQIIFLREFEICPCEIYIMFSSFSQLFWLTASASDRLRVEVLFKVFFEAGCDQLLCSVSLEVIAILRPVSFYCRLQLK